jgi:hypothetical protein
MELVENYGIIYDGFFEQDGQNCAYSCYLVSAKGEVKLETGKAVEYKWVSSLEEAAELLEVTEDTVENNVVFNAISNAFDIVYGEDEEGEEVDTEVKDVSEVVN